MQVSGSLHPSVYCSVPIYEFIYDGWHLYCGFLSRGCFLSLFIAPTYSAALYKCIENFANERTAQIYTRNEFTVPKFTIRYQYFTAANS